MSGNLSFIFDHPIIWKTDKWTNSSKHMFSFKSPRLGRLNADWSARNMTPDVTPYWILLKVRFIKVIIKRNIKIFG